MQKILSNKVNKSVKLSQSALSQTASRAMASGPQKNPFDSIKTSLNHDSKTHHYYKLPSLQDKRIGKCVVPPSRGLAFHLISRNLTCVPLL